jgi:uncharacterized protein (DUF58 family)
MIATPQASPIYCSVKELMLMRFDAMALSMPSAKRALRQQSGSHRSPFRGRGMEFSEVRLYQAGDDVRSIDWRVTARRQKPHTKLFHEERERPVLIVCDQSISQFFGSKTTFKSVRAAQSAALLAWMAIEKGDRVGGIVFSDKGHHEVRPARSRKSVMRLINVISEFNLALSVNGASKEADTIFTLNEALMETQRIAKPGTLIFILSDFLDFNETTKKHIQILSKHNNVAAIRNYDSLEMELPPPGSYTVSNGNKISTFQANTRATRELYTKEVTEFNKQLKQTMTNLGIPYIEQNTTESTKDIMQKLMKIVM